MDDNRNYILVMILAIIVMILKLWQISCVSEEIESHHISYAPERLSEDISPIPCETIEEPETEESELPQSQELPPVIKDVRRISIGVFKVTAYCSCEKCCGKWALNRPVDEYGNEIVYTASGAIAAAGKTIAVDPSIIPYGTEIILNDHIYVAEDCGGAIKGKKLDIYFDNHEDACAFGVQYIRVFIEESISYDKNK